MCCFLELNRLGILLLVWRQVVADLDLAVLEDSVFIALLADKTRQPTLFHMILLQKQRLLCLRAQHFLCRVSLVKRDGVLWIPLKNWEFGCKRGNELLYFCLEREQRTSGIWLVLLQEMWNISLNCVNLLLYKHVLVTKLVMLTAPFLGQINLSKYSF